LPRGSHARSLVAPAASALPQGRDPPPVPAGRHHPARTRTGPRCGRGNRPSGPDLPPVRHGARVVAAAVPPPAPGPGPPPSRPPPPVRPLPAPVEPGDLPPPSPSWIPLGVGGPDVVPIGI